VRWLAESLGLTTKSVEVLKNRPKLTEKELAKLVKELELNPKQCPFSNTTDWTLRSVYEEDHALTQFVREFLSPVPWGHHIEIMKKIKEPAARLWYLRVATRFGSERAYGLLLTYIVPC